jgi:hypothetical protein
MLNEFAFSLILLELNYDFNGKYLLKLLFVKMVLLDLVAKRYGVFQHFLLVG